MKNIYEFYNLIGKNLKEIRTKFGDSQEKLAEKTDMSRGFISQIESPGVDTGVSLDTLYNISQEYNIDIRQFFDGYEELMRDEKKEPNN